MERAPWRIMAISVRGENDATSSIGGGGASARAAITGLAALIACCMSICYATPSRIAAVVNPDTKP